MVTTTSLVDSGTNKNDDINDMTVGDNSISDKVGNEDNRENGEGCNKRDEKIQSKSDGKSDTDDNEHEIGWNERRADVSVQGSLKKVDALSTLVLTGAKMPLAEHVPFQSILYFRGSLSLIEHWYVGLQIMLSCFHCQWVCFCT